jgi:hypothetical protein
MWNRCNAPAVVTLAPILHAVIAADNISIDDPVALAARAAFIFPDISGMGDMPITHQNAPFLKAFFGA